MADLGQENWLAITHRPSPNLERCQLTHLPRVPIVVERAQQQHDAYCQMLRDCGAELHTLDGNRDLPDSVFIEDTAIILDEVAILTPMGTPARRLEPAGIEPELRKHRSVVRIEAPATIEGGDVVQAGRTLLVGLSARTNPTGVLALEALVRPFGYRVEAIPIDQCLHLKTACCALDDETLLVNPAWVDPRRLKGFNLVAVPVEERWAANVLRIGRSIGLSGAHPRTADLLGKLRYHVHIVDVSEFAKAEGGVTCMSLRLRDLKRAPGTS